MALEHDARGSFIIVLFTDLHYGESDELDGLSDQVMRRGFL